MFLKSCLVEISLSPKKMLPVPNRNQIWIKLVLLGERKAHKCYYLSPFLKRKDVVRIQMCDGVGSQESWHPWPQLLNRNWHVGRGVRTCRQKLLNHVGTCIIHRVEKHFKYQKTQRWPLGSSGVACNMLSPDSVWWIPFLIHVILLGVGSDVMCGFLWNVQPWWGPEMFTVLAQLHEAWVSGPEVRLQKQDLNLYTCSLLFKRVYKDPSNWARDSFSL